MSDRPTETIPKPFLACDFCGRNVQDGLIGVNVTLAKRRKVARENYENRLPTYLPIPPLVPWEILHFGCSEKIGRVEQTADEYRIDAKEIQSTNDLLKLTAYLIRKDWLADTGWSSTLSRIMADTVFHFDVKAEKKRKRAEARENAGEIVKAS